MTRRDVMIGATAALAAAPALAQGTSLDPKGRIRPDALKAALAALDALTPEQIPTRDVIAIADMGRHSSERRLAIVDLKSGEVQWFRCSHGVGSDPDHTGWMQRFSNVEGSLATPDGPFRIGAVYEGANGASKYLHGLTTDNANAYQREIVFHKADYAADSVVEEQGKLGRSHGCFVVGPEYHAPAMAAMQEGALLFSWKG
jgi:hypothetical protein